MVLAVDEHLAAAGLLYILTMTALTTLALYALERALPHALGRPGLADPLWPAWLAGGLLLALAWAVVGQGIMVYWLAYRLQERVEVEEGSLPADLAVHRQCVPQGRPTSQVG
jgi:hypothetical protein